MGKIPSTYETTASQILLYSLAHPLHFYMHILYTFFIPFEPTLTV